MIVDVHTHAPTQRNGASTALGRGPAVAPGRGFPHALSWDEHRRAMDPVDKAFVIGYPPADAAIGDHDFPSVTLEGVAEYAASDPNKLIGVMWLNPAKRKSRGLLLYGVRALNMKAVKVGPIYDDFDPLDRVAVAFYRRVETLGLPLVIHQATTFAGPGARRLMYAQPLLVEKIALAAPELRIVIAHMGHPWYWDTVALMRKEPNVYADISALFYRPWQFYNALLCAVEYDIDKKLLFGTDYPVTTPTETMQACRNVNEIVHGTGLPRIPEETVEGIINRDALSLLGMSAN